jgi:hypothetical protein
MPCMCGASDCPNCNPYGCRLRDLTCRDCGSGWDAEDEDEAEKGLCPYCQPVECQGCGCDFQAETDEERESKLCPDCWAEQEVPE